MKKWLSLILSLILALPAAAFAGSDALRIDMSRWRYDKENDVYWQVGIAYCTDPADTAYESLGIFVPGAYFHAEDNGDGTYTCTVDSSASAGGYTASTAPILFPVNTPGHKAQDAPTGYSKNASEYTAQGFVYVLAGCRGKDAGIPAGVTDLKAAIRYIRHNLDVLPGCTDRVTAYGMSGGGSQTAVLGASGNSALYDPYLAAIGAAEASDAVNAAMCWCPITGFDSADEGHEWSMGTTRTGLSDEMQAISDGLAAAYADYVNAMGFTDGDGDLLTLEESAEGIYQAGSYYEYVKDVIETSLENYLTDNTFPLSQGSGGRGRKSSSASYASAAEYVASLNTDGEWVTYDEASGEVTVTSVAAFSEHLKKASKPVAAFDKLEQGGHELFNTGDGECTHFDAVLAALVQGTEYEADFADDLSRTDALGCTTAQRLRMFSPLSFLLEANEDYGTADVASYWRIRTGITQSDTPLTTEINLALALEMYGADVDFETVWAQGHTQAERNGDAGDNFIAWLKSIYR